MNQPCYNSIALARHQHNLDRQEAKENFIAAAVDRLLADDDWLLEIKKKWFYCEEDVIYSLIETEAKEQANREYQQHLSSLEQARIDGQEGS